MTNLLNNINNQMDGILESLQPKEKEVSGLSGVGNDRVERMLAEEATEAEEKRLLSRSDDGDAQFDNMRDNDLI